MSLNQLLGAIKIWRNQMKNVIIVVFLLVVLSTAVLAQSVTTGDEHKCSVTGGARLVTRYHGANGEIFRNSFDQNAWAEVECKLSPRVRVYAGGWTALQFKEVDANVGVRYTGKKLSIDGQYQTLYLFNGKVLVHNVNFEVSKPVVTKERFTSSVFGRIETYVTQKHSGLAKGTYLVAGVNTSTKIGRDFTATVTPKILFDLNGAFNAKKGQVFLANAEITKRVGKFTTGPGVKFSFGTGRPTILTGYWSVYF